MNFKTALLLLALGGSASAAVIYDETVSGDLSGVFSAPDLLVLTDGANTISAQVGANGNTGATDGSDADYFSFSIAGGDAVTSITVDLFNPSSGDPGNSFVGFVAAPAFAGQGGGDIDGLAFINANSGDILGELGTSPLGPGTYTIWVQETADNISVDYQLTITQVPEPSVGLLAAFSALGLVLRRRR